jgi:hypothetical protein
VRAESRESEEIGVDRFGLSGRHNCEAPKRFRQTLEPGETDNLAEAYQAGSPIDDLAAMFEIDRSAIFKYMSAMDIPRRRPALGLDQCVEACRLYEAGHRTELD